MVLGLIAVKAMLYHKRLRHFVLLPSGVAFAGVLALVMINLGIK